MTYTPNYPSTGWRDLPDESTEIDADALNHIEAGIVSAAATADSALAGLAGKADTAAVAGKYTKPAPGIPNTDMTTTVQASLSKADTAVQPAALATKADLDGTGKIPQAQMPAVAVTDFLGAVGTQAAMLALTGQRGDWCTRTDRGTDFQLIAEPSSVLGSWRERTYPASPVSSVNGRTGAVDTSSADITDSTATGRALIKATDAAAARSAIGAGTGSSNLTIGTTSTTAMAGDRQQVVSSLPGSPVVGVLYLIPE